MARDPLFFAASSANGIGAECTGALFTFKLPKSDVLPRWRPRSPLMSPSRAQRSMVEGIDALAEKLAARGPVRAALIASCNLDPFSLVAWTSGALRHPSLRNFSTIGGELAHDLLVEPNIHFG